MSVSYSTRGPKKPRPPRPLRLSPVQFQIPAYMRAQKDYPEEFLIEEAVRSTNAEIELPGKCYMVKIDKGHSPKTKEGYSYVVRIHLEPDVPERESKFSVIAVYRYDDRPRSWANQMGKGTKPPPGDGLRPIWFVGGKPRSERMNSIISKAKARLGKSLRARKNSETG